MSKFGGNRHCSVLLIRTLHPHICRVASRGCMDTLRSQYPWHCGCSRLSCSVKCCLALQGSIPTEEHEQGLNVAKHQHETVIDHMNAALASEQAQQIVRTDWRDHAKMAARQAKPPPTTPNLTFPLSL